MKAQIAQMDKELERSHKTNTNLNLQIDDFKLRLKSTENELGDQRASVAKQKNVLTRVRADLHQAAQHLQQPKQLVDSVRSLYSKYCSSGKDYTTPLEDDVQNEYNRQRDFLERNVESLRKKLAKSEDMHKAESTRIMQENVALIREINDLRRELKIARSNEHQLEATLQTTRKISQMRGQTLPASTLEFSGTAGAANRTLSATQQADQLERIITMQKQEIRRLRSALQKLESHARDRPPSTGRLPELDTSAPLSTA